MPGLTGLSALTGLSGLMGGNYPDKVLSYDPIGYWRLNETGGVVANCLVDSAQNGTYTGVTLGQTITDSTGISFVCPYFDGTNDYVDLSGAPFNARFDGDTGSLILWCMVDGAPVWTDGSNRIAARYDQDANNFGYVRKSSANNTFQWRHTAGGVGATRAENPVSTTNWFFAVMTWTGGTMTAYRDAVQIGTQGVGAWAANPLASLYIGSSTGPPSAPWHGWLAEFAIFDSALQPGQISDLYSV